METIRCRNASSSQSESDEIDWEWVYAEQHQANHTGKASRRQPARQAKRDKIHDIVGARLGKFECFRGDCVILRTEGSAQAWIALIEHFVEGDNGEKEANFLWFSNEKEIRNRLKKRMDFLSNEVYITLSSDVNPLGSISGKATVMSHSSFIERFPAETIPRHSAHSRRVFVCRRGLDMRTTTYTEEFIWENVYQGPDALPRLIDLVREQTQTSNQRRHSWTQRTPEQSQLRAELGVEMAVSGNRHEHAPATPRVNKRSCSPNSSHKKSVSRRPLEFTPLGTRRLEQGMPDCSPFRQARIQLHVASVPRSLPGRERQFEEVFFQLEKAIATGTSNCIYISGTPGTGKTATVREVIAHLEGAVSVGELDDFIFLEINGMKLTDPHHSYAMLWEALKGDRVSPAQALDLLEREFRHPNPRRVPCVVLMDELDQLVTKNQSVMYNFFNWPALQYSRLIVLAVANTMDLPERTLSNKISSRLGLTRITFPGYSHGQLMRIIESRLESIPGRIVEPDAVQFASRKVAAVSGDARRALDICRRAVELVEADQEDVSATPCKRQTDTTRVGQNPGTVTISTIKRAISEATSSPMQHYLRSLAFLPKVFLVALLGRLRRTGLGESSLADATEEMTLVLKLAAGQFESDVFAQLVSIVAENCTTQQHRKANSIHLLDYIGEAVLELESAGILILEDRKAERPRKIRLGIGDEEVRMAFRDDPEMQAIGVKF